MDEIDKALLDGDPMRATEVAPLDAVALQALTELTMHETPTSLPRRRRLAVFVATAVALVAIPTTAIALNGGIHTGFFAGPDETESVPGGEYLNLSDPAIVDLVRLEAAKVPMPPGETLDAVIARFPVAEPTVGQREGIVGNLEIYAECRWYAHWLAGDAVTRTRDAAVIATFPGWAFVDLFAPGDRGPQLLRERVEQVQRGDETLVREFMAVNC